MKLFTSDSSGLVNCISIQPESCSTQQVVNLTEQIYSLEYRHGHLLMTQPECVSVKNINSEDERLVLKTSINKKLLGACYNNEVTLSESELKIYISNPLEFSIDVYNTTGEKISSYNDLTKNVSLNVYKTLNNKPIENSEYCSWNKWGRLIKLSSELIVSFSG